MNQAQSEALRKVVDYNWTDEERHYKETGQPKGHICEALDVLQCYLADVVHPYGQAGPIGIVREHEEPKQPATDDGAVDKLRWEILYSLLNFASCPEALKHFVNDALKVEDVDLLLAAQDALTRYLAKQDEIPF